MIITKTPYRCSFFGGGTDYPAWYREHGGAVLSATIDRYCYICLRYMPPLLGTKYRIFWSKAEAVDEISEIQHPGVRGCLRYLGIEDGLEVNHAGDLPARSGLGSSSAFTVGMLHALHRLQLRHVGRAQLADEAIEVEQKVLGETVGIQDQIQCAWGGLNVITFDTDGNYYVRPILPFDPLSFNRVDRLENHLVLVFTGIQRHASQIAEAQVSNIKRKATELHRIQAMVKEGAKAIEDGNIEALGELLHEGWMIKRTLSDKVTNSRIDGMYTAARAAGALGGKILGAGGGGFLLLCVEPEKRDAVLAAIGGQSVPVRFEYGGTQLVLE